MGNKWRGSEPKPGVLLETVGHVPCIPDASTGQQLTFVAGYEKLV